MLLSQVNSISEDDYFAKNAEFTTWLKEQRQLFFNDLSAEETRRLFAEFVEAWNARRLPAKLYAGVTGSAMRRTNHQWGFKGAWLSCFICCIAETIESLLMHSCTCHRHPCKIPQRCVGLLHVI